MARLGSVNRRFSPRVEQLEERDVPSFVTPVTKYNLDDTGLEPVLADFDGDGRLDAAVTVHSYATGLENVAVLLGNGAGTLALGAYYDIPDGLAALVAADLNADGNMDLATANCASFTVSVLLVRQRTLT